MSILDWVRSRRERRAIWSAVYGTDGQFGPFHQQCLDHLTRALDDAGFQILRGADAVDPRLPAFVVSGQVAATDLEWELFDYGANLWSSPPRQIEERFEEWDYDSPAAFYVAFSAAVVAAAIAFRDRAV
jgi:hypothetical protein